MLEEFTFITDCDDNESIVAKQFLLCNFFYFASHNILNLFYPDFFFVNYKEVC